MKETAQETSRRMPASDPAGNRFDRADDFPPGGRAADTAAVMALARELGCLLGAFVPPERFRPEPAELPEPPAPEHLRDLGASSLSAFYALALDGGGRDLSRVSRLDRLFPQGPESLGAALAALSAELAAAGPGRREELLAMKADLARADRLWVQLKKAALAWPQEARRLWRQVRRLEDRCGFIPGLAGAAEAAAEPPAAGHGPAVAEAAQQLRREMDEAQNHLWARRALAENLSGLLQELESAAVSEPEETTRDWPALAGRLAERWMTLNRDHQTLSPAGPATARQLGLALDSLAAAEGRPADRRSRDLQEQAETALHGVRALERSVPAARRAVARLYFALPRRIGRPLYLENLFLGAGLALGRTQARLEALKNHLEAFTGRLSETRRLRAGAARLLELLNRPQACEAGLARAHRRLTSFIEVARRRAADDRPAEEAARPTEDRLMASQAETRDLAARLNALAREKSRLGEELTAAKAALARAGRGKSRLFRIFERKNRLLRRLGRAGRNLKAENETIQAALARLERGRVRLLEVYRRDQGKRKQVNAALMESGARLELEIRARRRLLSELAQAKSGLARQAEEKQGLAGELRQTRDRLTEMEARETSLAAELAGQRQELDEAGRARRNLGGALSALRRRHDQLVPAHRALLASWRRRGEGLQAVRAENERLVDRLESRKKSLARLVETRQALRAELGTARLRLDGLAEERALARERLAQAQLRAEEDTAAKEGLTTELAAVRRQVSADLLPLLDVLGTALWRGERQLGETRAEADRRALELTADFARREAAWCAQAADREAELRAQATGREAELQAQAADREAELQAQAADREAELRAQATGREAELRAQAAGREAERSAEARKRESALELSLTEARRAGEEQSRANLRLCLAAAFLGEQARTVSGELAALREHAETDQAEHQAWRNDLLALARRQGLELERQKDWLARLATLVDFFLRSTGSSWAANLDLLEVLKRANRELTHRLRQAADEKLSLEGERAAVLEENLAARQSELAEVRDQAFALRRDNETLARTLAEQGAEADRLRRDLAEADQELLENDGRLEAAWAALNYLGARSGDTFSKLQGRLDHQARALDALRRELADKNAHLKRLETEQHRLTVLYWAALAPPAKAGRPEARLLPAPGPASSAADGEASPEGAGLPALRQAESGRA